MSEAHLHRGGKVRLQLEIQILKTKLIIRDTIVILLVSKKIHPPIDKLVEQAAVVITFTVCATLS